MTNPDITTATGWVTLTALQPDVQNGVWNGWTTLQVQFKPNPGPLSYIDEGASALVGGPTVVCTIREDGQMIGPDGNVGVDLIVGEYTVSFYDTQRQQAPSTIPVAVTPDHTQASPLDLNAAIQNGGAAGSFGGGTIILPGSMVTDNGDGTITIGS